MAIPQLSEEQIRTWTREQKDRWWLENVFRGSMPQLTIRAAITGFILGGLLSATNLYVGAQSGWTLGVGITSVILAFAMFKVHKSLFGRFGASDMTILENNSMQSVATAAGYMTGPLISGMAAYMWIENKPMPLYQMFWFNVVLSILGVLVAFPMKRKFINDDQAPFPEGRACATVLDTLYTSAAAVGLFKAKALVVAALIAGGIQFLTGAAYTKAIYVLYLMVKTRESASEVLKNSKDAIEKVWHLPHSYTEIFKSFTGREADLKLAGVNIQNLGINPAMELSLFGAGSLMGIKPAMSLIIGACLNYLVLMPAMISKGEILPKGGKAFDDPAAFSRTHIMNSWGLWWGIVLMVVASMVALFAKPQVFINAFKMIRGGGGGRKQAGPDVLSHIEMPLWISWVGIPLVGAVGVWMAHEWFGVSWVFGATSIPLIIVLTLVAANSTSITGTTPTGSLSKIPQFIYAAADPTHPPTNLMTGIMCVEVASNSSNLLMDIKPGYMLGGKPRHQAMGHLIGIFSGALFSTFMFGVLFLSNYKPDSPEAAKPGYLQTVMAPDGGRFGFPAAVQWKGVSELVTSIFAPNSTKTLLSNSIIISMVVAGLFALAAELCRIRWPKKFPLTPIAIGLGAVLTFDSAIMMFMGASAIWLLHKLYEVRKGALGHRLWVETHEPIAAGIIAGAALVGIGDAIVKILLDKLAS